MARPFKDGLEYFPLDTTFFINADRRSFNVKEICPVIKSFFDVIYYDTDLNKSVLINFVFHIVASEVVFSSFYQTCFQKSTKELNEKKYSAIIFTR